LIFKLFYLEIRCSIKSLWTYQGLQALGGWVAEIIEFVILYLIDLVDFRWLDIGV